MAAGAMVTGRMIHGDAPKQLPKPEAAPTKAARTADAEAAT
jgi:hypothetical protein